MGCYVGICGWVPTPRLNPCQGILWHAPPPSSQVHSHCLFDRVLPVPQTLPPPTAHLIPMSHAPTAKEKEEHVVKALGTSSNTPPEIPVHDAIGKLGLMQPNPPFGHSHDAIPLLNKYTTDGCPVECGAPWSRATVELLLRRGPHRSAMIKKAVKQLRTETLEKEKQGYARVVKWRDIMNDMPRNLKLSPVVMVPHKSKPYRCILDLYV